MSLFVAGAVLCAGFEVWTCDFVAGAGNREVAMCDGGDISWQAQDFVRVRRVDAERFVAGAGNREVVSCGRGECRCDIGIGVRAGVDWRSWNRETAWQGCAMGVLRWVFPLDFGRKSRTKRAQTLTCEFLRKSRTKRSFWSHDV